MQKAFCVHPTIKLAVKWITKFVKSFKFNSNSVCTRSHFKQMRLFYLFFFSFIVRIKMKSIKYLWLYRKKYFPCNNDMNGYLTFFYERKTLQFFRVFWWRMQLVARKYWSNNVVHIFIVYIMIFIIIIFEEILPVYLHSFHLLRFTLHCNHFDFVLLHQSVS